MNNPSNNNNSTNKINYEHKRKRKCKPFGN